MQEATVNILAPDIYPEVAGVQVVLLYLFLPQSQLPITEPSVVVAVEEVEEVAVFKFSVAGI